MDDLTERELLIRIDERVRNLEREFRDFKNQMSENYVRQDQFSKMCADVTWIKKFFWVVTTAGIGGFVAGMLALLVK